MSSTDLPAMPDTPAAPAAPAAPSTVEAADEGHAYGLWRDTLRNILRQRSARLGLLLIGFFVVVAFLAPVLAPFDPDKGMLDLGEVGAVKRSAPCIHLLGCPADQPQHLLGLDGNFRDVFSRIVYGARVSLFIGVVTVGFAIVIGSLIGLVAGYTSGKTDNVLMRLMDVLLGFPSLILAIAIVTVMGRSLVNAQLAIGIVAIPLYARVMRSSVLSIREQDFVTATRALGESASGILFRRILPNSLTPIVVAGTLGVAGAILDVAALSFLGVGAQPPLAEWGSMIGLERNQLFSAPHLVLAPGIAIVITVLGFNLLGDGIRDALDPRLNR